MNGVANRKPFIQIAISIIWEDVVILHRPERDADPDSLRTTVPIRRIYLRLPHGHRRLLTYPLKRKSTRRLRAKEIFDVDA